MKAREVLEQYVDKFSIDQLPSQFADWVIKELSEAGFVILPKEPSEGMIEAAFKELFEPESSVSRVEMENIYRAIISHAGSE
ncbi:MAG: hypothetical protein KF826_03490 [Xanthobacteraceae bacterium]|nr:hypothetical protein [Xanthobacteraceae bacterium]